MKWRPARELSVTLPQSCPLGQRRGVAVPAIGGIGVGWVEARSAEA
ncbi:MAG: hypothetical protein ACRCTL_14905 [Pseudomonas sp.]